MAKKKRSKGWPAVQQKRRFSAQKKAEVVRRLIAGEDLDALARELSVTAAALAGWRDKFVAAGEASLKTRPRDDKDDEIQRLKAMIGDFAMRNELLREQNRAIRDGESLGPQRPRP